MLPSQVQHPRRSWAERILSPRAPAAYGGFTAETLSVQGIRLLKETERSNRDRGADSYLDRLRAARGAFQLRAEIDTILGTLDPRGDEVALDAGAGVGRVALHMADRGKHLVCADLSPGALEVLSSSAAERAIDNVETIACDLGALPASLGPFDLAYTVEVFNHIPSHGERIAAMDNLFTVLRPGGRLLICVLAWTWRSRQAKEGFWGKGEGRTYRYYFTVAELRALMEAAGFRDVSIRVLRVLPGRVTRHLPASLAFLETWCSRIPALRSLGSFLIATGRRPDEAPAFPRAGTDVAAA